MDNMKEYEEMTLVFQSEGTPEQDEIPAEEFEKIMEESEC